MKRIAKFHKVSLEQFMEGWKDTFGEQYTEDQLSLIHIFRGGIDYIYFSPISGGIFSNNCRILSRINRL